MPPGTDCSRDDVMMLNGDSCDYRSAQMHTNRQRATERKQQSRFALRKCIKPMYINVVRTDSVRKEERVNKSDRERIEEANDLNVLHDCNTNSDTIAAMAARKINKRMLNLDAVAVRLMQATADNVQYFFFFRFYCRRRRLPFHFM